MSLRVVICTVAGLCAVLLLLAVTPKANYAPRGIVLPAKVTRAPTLPDQVTVYDSSPTAVSQRLGSIRVEMTFTDLNSEARDRLFDEAKSLAASIGGNGVVVKVLVPSDGLRHVLTLMGTVIYIPNKGARS